jgi:branched-chain amino acid transport system substrate-binding protein
MSLNPAVEITMGRVRRRATWSVRATLGVLAAAALVPANVQAAELPPYRLGYLVDASGTQQTTIKPSYDAFKIYVDLLNKDGGINGRKIEILARDTQSNVQRSLDAVQDLGRQEVLGILGLAATNAHAAVYAAARKLGIPVLAGYPINIPTVLPPAKPGAFGVGLELSVAGTAGAHLARQVSPQGRSEICIAFEVPGSMLACQKLGETAKALGFTQVDMLTVPITQRDFRVVVGRIVRANPDVVTDCLGQAHVAALLPALATSAYSGIFLSMDTGIGDDTLRAATPVDSRLTVYSYGRFVSVNDGESAELDALRAALKEKGLNDHTSSYPGGWALGLVVTQALRKCPNKCVKPSDFEAALEQVDLDTGGLTGIPIRLSAQDHYGPSAYRLYKYDNKERTFSVVGDWLHVGSDGKISG